MEICQIFQIQNETASPEDIHEMEFLWKAYEKRNLWKSRSIEESHFDSKSKKLQGKTYQQELHDWEDFACVNFVSTAKAFTGY